MSVAASLSDFQTWPIPNPQSQFPRYQHTAQATRMHGCTRLRSFTSRTSSTSSTSYPHPPHSSHMLRHPLHQVPPPPALAKFILHLERDCKRLKERQHRKIVEALESSAGEQCSILKRFFYPWISPMHR